MLRGVEPPVRDELEFTRELLGDFAGAHVWEKAQAAIERIAWLKRALAISEYNERAAHAVIRQEIHENERLRQRLAHYGYFNHGGSHGEEAREASRPEGKVEERKSEGSGGGDGRGDTSTS